MVRNKELASDFALPDESGVTRSLIELRGGKPFLLLFSRFAGCPTSRRDLQAYADVYDRLQALGVGTAVVTADTPENHRQLRERLELPFHLLSDTDFRVSERYDVYRSDEVEEGPQPHGEPALFVLDVDGRVAYSQILSGPKGQANPAEIALLFLYMSAHGGRYW